MAPGPRGQERTALPKACWAVWPGPAPGVRMLPQKRGVRAVTETQQQGPACSEQPLRKAPREERSTEAVSVWSLPGAHVQPRRGNNVPKENYRKHKAT